MMSVTTQFKWTRGVIVSVRTTF